MEAHNALPFIAKITCRSKVFHRQAARNKRRRYPEVSHLTRNKRKHRSWMRNTMKKLSPPFFRVIICFF